MSNVFKGQGGGIVSLRVCKEIASPSDVSGRDVEGVSPLLLLPIPFSSSHFSPPCVFLHFSASGALLLVSPRGRNTLKNLLFRKSTWEDTAWVFCFEVRPLTITIALDKLA
jgi:hypothetical protein